MVVLLFLKVKHRNAINSVQRSNYGRIRPIPFTQPWTSFLCSSCVAPCPPLLPVHLLSAVSHRGSRKYLHQIRHLRVIPFTSSLCSCYIDETCMNSERRHGLASSTFLRLLFPLETLVVGGSKKTRGHSGQGVLVSSRPRSRGCARRFCDLIQLPSRDTGY